MPKTGLLRHSPDVERLLAERTQDIFSIIQRDWTPSVIKRAKITENTKADLP
jgi:hypothetical protein